MIIAIASGKGGTGKTTLATNLSVFLSQTEKVTLADLDVEAPNSGLFLHGDKVTSQDIIKRVPQWQADRCTLCGVCQNVCNFHAVIRLGQEIMVFPELCHGCYACSELCLSNALPMVEKVMGQLTHYQTEQLSFIESRLNIGEEQAVPAIRHTLDYVQQHTDPDSLIILDSPPGTSCPVIEATQRADYVVLVTEPTPFGLHDLHLAVETMKKLEKNFGVVINRHGIGNDAVDTYCQSKGIEVIVRIPDLRKIAEAYSKGQLVLFDFPVVREAMARIQEKIYKLAIE